MAEQPGEPQPDLQPATGSAEPVMSPEVAIDQAFYAAVAKHFHQTVQRIPLPDRRFYLTEPNDQRLKDLVPEAVPDDEEETTNNDDAGDEIQPLVRSLRKQRLRSGKRRTYSDIFVQSFEPKDRRSLNCCFCRRFVDRFSCLVTIDDRTGMTQSLMWQVPESDVPDFYKKTVRIMRQAVEQAGVITGPLNERLESWGLEHTTKKQDWFHLTITPVPDFRVPRPIEGVEVQLMRDVLTHFPVHVVDAAAALVADSLTDSPHRIVRPDVFSDTVTWFQSVAQTYATFSQSLTSLDDETKDFRTKNLLWSLVCQAPGPSYTHLKNNMTGELLDAVAEYIDPETKVLDKVSVVWRINDRLQSYREQTAGPSEQQLAHAQVFLKESGLIKSLEKQFALPEDIPVKELIWQDRSKEVIVGVKEEKEPAVEPDDPVSRAIAQVATTKKEKKPVTEKKAEEVILETGAVPISWKAFKETILPDVESLEIKWPSESDEKLFTLFSCVHADAPSLHKWGNNCSWSFKRGGLVPGETRRRVLQAGGSVEDCPVRVSLIWQTFDDLDLDVITPAGERIYFSHRKSECGGELDTDANGMDKRTETPVENTRWFKSAPVGTYVVKVIAYGYHTESEDPVDFGLEIEVDGVRHSMEGTAGLRGRVRGEIIDVATIDYRPSGPGTSKVNARLESINAPIWGHDRGSWQPVREVFLLPNSWPPATPETKVEKCSLPQILGFAVRGCTDVKESRAWHIETLVSDCRLHERSLQAIGRKIEIGRRDHVRKVCGVGESFDAPSDWDTCVRAKRKSTGSSTVYRLDRPE